MDEALQKTLSYLKAVADKLGYVLNPNDKALSQTASYMAANKQTYGRRFCPCKQHYPVDQSVDPVCPCPEFQDEIIRDGHCECHIFFDKAAAVQAKRRPGLLATVTCPG